MRIIWLAGTDGSSSHQNVSQSSTASYTKIIDFSSLNLARFLECSPSLIYEVLDPWKQAVLQKLYTCLEEDRRGCLAMFSMSWVPKTATFLSGWILKRTKSAGALPRMDLPVVGNQLQPWPSSTHSCKGLLHRLSFLLGRRRHLY